MREVLPNLLWIGNAADAGDLARIHEIGIAAVVDLALEEPPARMPRELACCRFPLRDGAGNSPEFLRACVDAVVSLLRNGVPTLVCCGAGMSRSPIIVAAALAVLRARPLQECLQQVTAGQPHDVSPGFWNEVMTAVFPSSH